MFVVYINDKGVNVCRYECWFYKSLCIDIVIVVFSGVVVGANGYCCRVVVGVNCLEVKLKDNWLVGIVIIVESYFFVIVNCIVIFNFLYYIEGIGVGFGEVGCI